MPDFPLSGKTRFRAQALLLGQRLSLRAWQPADALAMNPLTVVMRGGGVAVLFRYGAVVFFDVDPLAREAFLSDLRSQVGNPYATPESEEVEVRVGGEAREGMKADAVVLEAATVERLQVIADVLSKSVLLAFYESSIAGTFDRIEPMAVELERSGRIAGKTRELLRHIGATLHTETQMVGRAAVTDKPEILWDAPGLEGLYLRLEDEYEIEERYSALEQKLGVISRTAQTLTETLDTRHSLRVEWYIVILIVAEILLTLYELFIHSR